MSGDNTDIDLENATEEELAALGPQQLANIIMKLCVENKQLKQNVDPEVAKRYDQRLENLEREVNKNKQYLRRESIEFVGISTNVKDEDIETEVIKIMKAAKVKISRREVTTLDIHAAHRKNQKGDVIVKFTNRKWAESAMRNRGNLKDGQYGNCYINTSLCPEYAYLAFAVRKAKKDKLIDFWKLKHGMPFVRIADGDDFVEISHVNDLIKHGIPVPERRF